MNKTIKKFQTGFLTSIKPERLFKTFAIIACLLIAGAFLTLGGNVIVKDGQLNVTSDFFVGTDVLFVDSAENKVGIGTTSPNEKLTVVGNVNITENITIGDKLTFAFNEFIDNLIDGWLRVTGSLNITQNLKVTQNLNVGGDANITGDLKVDGNITGSSPVKIKGGLNVLNASCTTHLYVNDTTGNVGVGTTSPGYKLDVSGTGRFTGTVTAPIFSGALSGNADTANISSDLNCTDCIGPAEINDSYVLNTGDAMTGALVMGDNKITGLATPAADTDAATKHYVDSSFVIQWRNVDNDYCPAVEGLTCQMKYQEGGDFQACGGIVTGACFYTPER